MIKPLVPYSVSVTALADAVWQIGREYGSPVADSGDASAEVYTVIVSEAYGPSAQRAISHPDLSMYRFRLIALPADAWPRDRWVVARKGVEGIWCDAP